MKRFGQIAICLAAALALSAGTRAVGAISSGNPYMPIIERNVFDLKPLPPPGSEETNKANENLPKITPNGIMSIFGQLQVLFKVAPKPGVKDAKETPYVLSEGQSQDEIEVVSINEKAALVTFNNHGTVQEIPLANAPKVTTPVAAGGGPGGGVIPPRLGGPRGGASSGASGGPNPRFGGRFGGGPGAAQNTGPGGADNPGAMGNVGARNQVYTGEHLNQGGQKLTAEQNAVLIEAQRAEYQKQGDPRAKLLPPTALTPLLNNEGDQ